MTTQAINWQAVFFDFLVGAFLIFIFFRLVQYLVPVLLAKRKKYQNILRMLPVVETIFWLLFFSWYIFKFAEIMSIYTLIISGILLVLIYWISRFFLKDLIAGMFFRTNGRFKEGEVISQGNYKGFIRKFGLQSLEIESHEGQIIFIPYSKLLDSHYIKSESEEQSAAYTFSITLNRTLSREETIDQIKSFIISLPWSSIQKTPVILLKEQSEESFFAEITAFPIEKDFGRKIEQITIQEFSDHQ